MRKTILGTFAIGGAIFAAACGSAPRGGDPDAPAAADAPATTDAPVTGTVHVTFTDGAYPVKLTAGLPVVFSTPDGTVTAVAMTAADGTASGVVTAGDTVTALGQRDAWTVLDVQPGDELVIHPVPPDAAKLGTFQVTAPARAGTTFYGAYSPCSFDPSRPTPAISLAVLASCPATADVVMVAYDAGGTPQAYLMASGTAFTAGGSVALAGAWKPMPTLTATYTDVDVATVTALTASRLDELGVGWGYGVAPPKATQVLSGPTMPGTGAFVVTDVQGAPVASSNPATQHRIDLIGDTDATFQLDLGAALLPWLHPPQLDVAAGVLHVPDATPATGGFAGFEIRFDNAAHTDGHAWTIVGPRLGDVALPKLTGALAARNIPAADRVGASTTWLDTGGADAYATARAHAIERFEQVAYGNQRIHARSTSSGGLY